MFSKNMQLGKPIYLSSFRKVALGTWNTVGDPSVYGKMELDVEPALKYIEKLKAHSGLRITITHFIGKACAETIRQHPQINSLLRWGRIYPRKNIDIFFQVASDTKGEDLTGTTIRKIDQKSVIEIAQDIQKSVERIRSTGDIDYKVMKKTINAIPAFLSKILMQFSAYIMYTLNIWTPSLGVPKDPFGTMMITNIGSLGLDSAYVPLVPYARIPCLIAVGAIKDVPAVSEGKIIIKKIITLSVTFDHRIIDGMHASHMAKTLKKIFANPELELSAR